MLDTNIESLSIYLHWPFCLSKCPYCDFMSVVPTSPSLYDDFGRYLLEDLKKSVEKINIQSIKSIFFGGGTPSLMSAKSVEKILEFLRANYFVKDDVEITLEANPGTFNIQNMKDFYSAGINRLSLGIQSFSDTNLNFLGRIYDSKQAKIAADSVSNVFDNFSIDLMYGYECQNLESLRLDLQTAIDFGCKHLSCYQLTFEEKTPFYNRLLSGDIKQIDEDKEIYLYDYINTFLKKHGIFRYEVSNYATKGYESKHNLSYWNYDDYLGVGPGAHSRITAMNARKNEIIKISDPYEWAESLKNPGNSLSHLRELTMEEEFQEIIIMGLRMSDGLNIKTIYGRIPKILVDKIITSDKLQFLYNNGLIEKEIDKIQLTESGIIRLNAVIDFLQKK